jgi:hypothetical protein
LLRQGTAPDVHLNIQGTFREYSVNIQ